MNPAKARRTQNDGAVVKDCLENRRSRIRPPLWPSGSRETKVSSSLASKGLKFRILCLEGSVITFILAQLSLYVHTGGPKPIYSFIHTVKWTGPG